MDSASPTLLSRARQGQPHAIATLIQRRLNSREIDVMAWKKQDLLHIELMSFDGLFKADMLSSIQATLSEAMPKGVRATKISNYIYGEEAPRWIGRIAVAAAPTRTKLPDVGSGDAAYALRRRFVERFEAITKTPRRRLAVGAVLSLGLIISGVLSTIKAELPLPGFAANQQGEKQPVKTRRQGL